jgi:preprotein translocase subunit SecA
MDYLQEGIGLRAMGQRDPLVEYQREGFDMFVAMMDAIKEESVGFLFNVEVQVEEAPPAPVDLIATGPGEAAGEVMVEHLLTGAEPTPAHEIPASPTGGLTQAQETPAARPEPGTAEPEPAQASSEASSVVEVPVVEVPVAPAPVAEVLADPAPVAPAPVAEAPVVEVPSASAAPAAEVPSAPAAPEAPAVPEAPAAPEAPSAAPTEPPARTVLPEGFGRPDRPTSLQYSAPSAEGGVSTTGTPKADPLTGQVTSGSGGPSRNAPCPCGSGRKYKRCHGSPGTNT